MSLSTFLIQLIMVIVEGAVATYVGISAWHHRPARAFVITITALMVLNGLELARIIASDRWSVEFISDMNALMQAIFLLGLLLMFSALFVPQWWEGRRAIIGIASPYAISTLLVFLDLFFNLGIFATGIELPKPGAANSYNPFILTALGTAFLNFYVLGSLVILVILVVALIRTPSSRRVIGILALSLFSAIIFILLAPLFGFQAYSILIVLPLLAGLTYAVLSTDLLIPIRIAADMSLQALRDAVVVVDTKGIVLFCNPAAAALGVIEHQSLVEIMGALGAPVEHMQLLQTQSRSGIASESLIEVSERQFELRVSPIANRNGKRQGALVFGRDVTELREYTTQLEAERTRLATAVRELEAHERERTALTTVIQTLAIPLIPVLPGVLIMPLVGNFDQLRQHDLITVLLGGIERERAALVLIDITGIPLLDTFGAQTLLQAVNAARLLGARCVLVGVRPEIAQALVSLGVELGNLETSATLQQALQLELRKRRT